jgi:hypothetical protein
MSKLLLSHRYFNRSLKVCSAFPSRKLAADGDIPQAMHPAFLNSKSPKQSAHFKCVRFFGKDCQLRMGQLNIFIVGISPPWLTPQHQATLLLESPPKNPVSSWLTPVCTDNLNAGVAVMKSAQDGA